MSTKKIAQELAEIYANCKNGKQRGVNYAEWKYSFDGWLEGYEQCRKDAEEILVKTIEADSCHCKALQNSIYTCLRCRTLKEWRGE